MSTRQPSLLRKAISILASFALAVAFVPVAWANTTEGAESVSFFDIGPDTNRSTYKGVLSDGLFSYDQGTMLITAEKGITWSGAKGSVESGSVVTVTITANEGQRVRELVNRGTVVASSGSVQNAPSLVYTTTADDVMEFEPRFDDPGSPSNPSDPTQPEAPATAIRIVGGNDNHKALDSLYYSLENIDVSTAGWRLLKEDSSFSNNMCSFGKNATVYLKYVAPEGSTQSVYLIKESTQIGERPTKTKFEPSASLSLTGEGTIAFCDPGKLKVSMPSGYSAKYRFADTADCANVVDSSWTEVGSSGFVSIPVSEGSASPTHAFVKIITSDGQGRAIDYAATEIRIDGAKNHEADTKSLTSANGFMFADLSASSEYVIDVADTATRTASFSIDKTSLDVLSHKCTEMTVGYGDRNDMKISFNSDGTMVGGSVALPANTTEQLRIAVAIASDKYYIPYIWINDKKCATVDTGKKDSQGHVIIGATVRDAEAAKESFKINLSMGAVAQVGFSEEDSRDSNVRKVSAGYLLVDQGKTVRESEIGNVTLDVRRLEEAAAGVGGAVQSFDLGVKVGESSSNVSSIDAPLDITMELDTSRYTESDYTVYREHDGTTEDLNATYDRETGALTFRSNLFSTYTIAIPGNNENNNPGAVGSDPVAPPYAPSTPAPSEPEKSPISNTGDDNSTSTTVDVTDKVTTTETGSTQVAVDADLGTKIVENAIENKVADVVIKAETTAGNSAATAVALPASTVKELAEKTEASVTISTDSAQVTLDKAAVAAVAEQAGDAGSVQLVVETSEQNANKVQIEVRLETASGTVSDFRGGSVTISVPVTEELAAKKLVCVYIDENGKYTKMPGALSADGKSYVFATGHFSTYAVMAESEANAAIAEQEKAEAVAIAKAKPGTASVKLSSPAKSKLTVKASAKKAKGYRVYYKKAGWKAYKTYTTSGTVKSLSKTFKKLSKGTYTVKVRAFGKTAAGKVVWGAKSKAKKVAVK